MLAEQRAEQLEEDRESAIHTASDLRKKIQGRQAFVDPASVGLDMDRVEALLERKKVELNEWKTILESAEKAVADVLENTTAYSLEGALPTNAVTLLENLKKTSLTGTTPSFLSVNELNRTTKVLMEKPPVCTQKLEEQDDSIDRPVESQDLETMKVEIEGVLNGAGDWLGANESGTEVLATWIKKQSQLVARKKKEAILPKQRKPRQVSFGLEAQVESAIEERLWKDAADLTGEVDYASIRMGAQVIRKGPHRTSQSLIDNLPLANKVMHMAGVRFYGHGPEAALTPTFPRTALGQCWSFSGSNKSDRLSGNLGTLSVRLPKKIIATSILLEHQPEQYTNAKTAPRLFRVIGYEDEHALSRPLELGMFEYDIDGSPMQEYEIKRKQQRAIQSITLSVDANWGAPYTCLYRFRVHGAPAE